MRLELYAKIVYDARDPVDTERAKVLKAKLREFNGLLKEPGKFNDGISKLDVTVETMGRHTAQARAVSKTQAANLINMDIDEITTIVNKVLEKMVAEYNVDQVVDFDTVFETVFGKPLTDIARHRRTFIRGKFGVTAYKHDSYEKSGNKVLRQHDVRSDRGRIFYVVCVKE